MEWLLKIAGVLGSDGATDIVDYLGLAGVIAVAFLTHFVKKHVTNRIEEQGKTYGKIDAKVERLPDLTKIAAEIKRSQSEIEREMHAKLEALSQQNRIELAYAQIFAEKRINAYEELLRKAYGLQKAVAGLSADWQQNLPHLNTQNDFTEFFHQYELYIGKGVRRAAHLVEAVTNDIVVVGRTDEPASSQARELQDRTSLVSDLLRRSITKDIRTARFQSYIPTSQETQRWVEQSRDIAALRRELEKTSDDESEQGTGTCQPS